MLTDFQSTCDVCEYGTYPRCYLKCTLYLMTKDSLKHYQIYNRSLLSGGRIWMWKVHEIIQQQRLNEEACTLYKVHKLWKN